MNVRPPRPEEFAALAASRQALWPAQDAATHLAELHDGAKSDDVEVFCAFADGGALIGFAEASVRYDHVNGCDSSPVAFLEGIYTKPAFRRRGVAAALVSAVESWGREKGCTQLGSDALLENHDSHKTHEALGFEEAERVVYFRKNL